LLVGPEAELEVNKQHQKVFAAYIKIVDDQIKQVREEAKRRKNGKPPMQATSDEGHSQSLPSAIPAA